MTSAWYSIYQPISLFFKRRAPKLIIKAIIRLPGNFVSEQPDSYFLLGSKRSRWPNAVRHWCHIHDDSRPIAFCLINLSLVRTNPYSSDIRRNTYTSVFLAFSLYSNFLQTFVFLPITFPLQIKHSTMDSPLSTWRVFTIHAASWFLAYFPLLHPLFFTATFNSSGIFGSYNPLTRLFPTECCPTFMIQCPIHLFTFVLIMFSPRLCFVASIIHDNFSFLSNFLKWWFFLPKRNSFCKNGQKTMFTPFRMYSFFTMLHPPTLFPID